MEELLREIENLPDQDTREKVREMIVLFLDLHGEALDRLMGLLAAGREGEGRKALLEELAGDEVVGSLLVLYGIHPEGPEDRVRRALREVAPALASHGGHVELVSIDEEGILRLRLEGSCHGCPSSLATLRGTLEDAIRRRAPELVDIVLDGTPVAAGGTEAAP
jgi:Fe-S cluster biogenesis protein NfuA